ncbi:MAG: inorganic diphosphatase [Bacteroidota bacterium]|nr:inorganic diphosphatase [Bacteroidota bacterium]
MEVIQHEKNKKERNDRFLFVADSSHEYEDIRSVHDLSAKKLEEIEDFFKFYNAAEDKKLHILGYKKSHEALSVTK